MDFPHFDHSAPPKREPPPYRDWVMFGLAFSTVALLGLCGLQWLQLVRKYSPKIVTKTIEREVIVERPIVVPEPTPPIVIRPIGDLKTYSDLDVDEHDLITHASTSSGKDKDTFSIVLKETHDTFHVYAIENSPLELLVTMKPQGRIAVAYILFWKDDLFPNGKANDDTFQNLFKIARITNRLARAVDSDFTIYRDHEVLAALRKEFDKRESSDVITGEYGMIQAILDDRDGRTRVLLMVARRMKQ